MVGTLAHSTIRRFVMQSSTQLMGCNMETPAYRKKKVQEMLDYLKEIGLSVCGPVFKDGVEYPAFMDYDADEIISRRKHIQDGTIKYSKDWL